MKSGQERAGLGQRQPQQRQSFAAHLLLIGAVALLLVTNAITGLALYFSPEINQLMRADNSTLSLAYEQRITELRLEVDRLHSRQYAQMGDMNLQMHELIQQQEVLSEQHEYVRALTDMARAMGIASQNSADAVITGSIASQALASGGDTVALAASITTMQNETRMALAALSDAATLSTNEILDGLRVVGLEPQAVEGGTGGPFIPIQGSGESIIDEANTVADALARYQSARMALLSAPVRMPIKGTGALTSKFGNRIDPFLNREAFHSGIDFRATTGTPVLAAAGGEITFAGTNGGYGKMVEIDHGNGLLTRYAHLSRIGVELGQSVLSGQQLGLSGSTGRSTGPHLHFEVRRSGTAIDPSRFIAAGQALSPYL